MPQPISHKLQLRLSAAKNKYIFFKVLKEKKWKQRILCLAKITFKTDEIKTHSESQNLRDLMKDVLHTEGRLYQVESQISRKNKEHHKD